MNMYFYLFLYYFVSNPFHPWSSICCFPKSVSIVNNFICSIFFNLISCTLSRMKINSVYYFCLSAHKKININNRFDRFVIPLPSRLSLLAVQKIPALGTGAYMSSWRYFITMTYYRNYWRPTVLTIRNASIKPWYINPMPQFR